MTNFIQKFAPTTNDLQEHVMPLSIEDIRAIDTLRHYYDDMLGEAIPSEIKLRTVLILLIHIILLLC